MKFLAAQPGDWHTPKALTESMNWSLFLNLDDGRSGIYIWVCFSTYITANSHFTSQQQIPLAIMSNDTPSAKELLPRNADWAHKITSVDPYYFMRLASEKQHPKVGVPV
jgi:hypothetical protein